MSFVVRSVQFEDLEQLYDLARQFTLLNLPADRKVLEKKIARSVASFEGDVDRDDAEYCFVVADKEDGFIAGSSTIVAKSGTKSTPNYSFKVLKKERFSRDLGVGFIHQILRLHINTNGPTEVGGLVVDRSYRNRPEKVGRLASLSRFLYIGMKPERFEDELHAEMAPPLTEEGRSEFWEALGRRFTGMPYKEADAISSQNNGFIQSLFPEEDIYLCLLDSKARLVLGRVGEETQAALHMLNKLGFKYKEEVDPFDGGPHLTCPKTECTIVKNLKSYKLKKGTPTGFEQQTIFGLLRNHQYYGGVSSYSVEGDHILFPEKTWSLLDLNEGEKVYL